MSEELTPLKRAFLAIEKLQAKLHAAEAALRERDARPTPPEPIAVVGLGVRFHDADAPDALWRLLADGVDAVREVPIARFDVAPFYDPEPGAPGRTYARHASFVPHVEDFDARFFGISPREAAALDPQHRLLLEVAHEALEDAGVPADRLAGTAVGVFVGAMSNDWSLRQLRDPARIDPFSGAGTEPSAMAGRLSHVLGVRGPCLTVSTACSSSLVAIHLACASLRARECGLALAGGVNLVLLPDALVTRAQARMLSARGRCFAFDARADGYVPGEGCGVVALERLADARAAGHPVLGVIRASAVNHNGVASGLTVPSRAAQAALIREAWTTAGYRPADADYVECHGTGTALGDPIEVGALADVMEGRRTPLWIGTIKANLGHTEAAAGVAGLAKVLLALRHGQIPPNLHFERPNPHAPFDAVPARVPTTAVPWPAGPRPRLAGVSSFGFSGTNAHLVVEEAPRGDGERTGERTGEGERGPPSARALSEARAHLLCVSASSRPALAGLIERYAAIDADPGDLCASAHRGRSRLPHRAFAVGRSTRELVEGLARLDPARRSSTPESGGSRGARVGFLFTGQGAAWPGMGLDLARAFPAFEAALARCDAALRPALGRPLPEILADADALDDTTFAQPALVALGWSLAAWWASIGVIPSAVLGHSVGEYTAAAVAGVLSIEDALGLVATRARLMGALPRAGAMLAVEADEVTVRAALVAPAAIAAINGPNDVVIAGDADAVRATAAALGARATPLRVSHAFHSPLLAPIADDLHAAAARLSFRPPRIPLVSNLSGRPIAAIDAAYWVEHALRPVRFADGLAALPVDLGLDLGPHPVLAALASRQDPRPWLGTLQRGRDGVEALLGAVGTAFTRGVDVALEALDPARRPWVALPKHPWMRERCWPEEEETPVFWGEEVRVERAREGERASARARPDGPPRFLVEGHAAEALAWRLRRRGCEVQVIPDGEILEEEVSSSTRRVLLATGPVRDAPADDAPADDAPAADAPAMAHAWCARAIPLLRGPIPPWIVTRGARAARDPTGLAGAALGGLVRAAALERRVGGWVDLADDEAIAEGDALDALAEELVDPDEPEVALGPRAVPRLVARPPREGPALPVRGTWLIVGGAGALGRQIAAFLRERGARVVLTSRSGGPGIVAVDAADRAGMAALVAGLPELRGVVHAAGAAVRGRVEAIGPAELAVALRAKVDGAQVLHEVTRGVPLDAFVLCGSIAAVWGSAGLGAYAAANAFLGGLARHRRGLGLPAMCVAWGLLEGGLATNEDAARLAGIGLRALSERDVREALSRIVEEGGAPGWDPVIARVNLPKLRRALEARGPQPRFERVAPARAPSAPAREAPTPTLSRGEGRDPDPSSPLVRALAAAPGDAARRALLEDAVQRHVAAILGFRSGAVDVDQGWFELGMDSVMAMELQARLGRELGREVSAALLFDHPSVRALAGALLAGGPGVVAEAPLVSAAPAALDAMTDDEALRALLGSR